MATSYHVTSPPAEFNEAIEGLKAFSQTLVDNNDRRGCWKMLELLFPLDFFKLLKMTPPRSLVIRRPLSGYAAYRAAKANQQQPDTSVLSEAQQEEYRRAQETLLTQRAKLEEQRLIKKEAERTTRMLQRLAELNKEKQDLEVKRRCNEARRRKLEEMGDGGMPLQPSRPPPAAPLFVPVTVKREPVIAERPAASTSAPPPAAAFLPVDISAEIARQVEQFIKAQLFSHTKTPILSDHSAKLSSLPQTNTVESCEQISAGSTTEYESEDEGNVTDSNIRQEYRSVPVKSDPKYR